MYNGSYRSYIKSSSEYLNTEYLNPYFSSLFLISHYGWHMHFRVYPILMWKSSGQMTCILMALKWVVYCVRQHIGQRSLMSVLVNCLVLLMYDLYKLMLCSFSRISGSFTAALHLFQMHYFSYLTYLLSGVQFYIDRAWNIEDCIAFSWNIFRYRIECKKWETNYMLDCSPTKVDNVL